MPDNNLITSNQQTRVMDFAAQVARNATLDVLDKMNPLEKDFVQKNLIKKGGEFQVLIAPDFTTIIEKALNKMLERKDPQAEKIEEFYLKVLNHKIDLSGIVFPEKDGMPCYMADDPTGLTDDEIFSRGVAYFKKLGYSYKSPIASNINLDAEQKRPKGPYVFASRGGDEPDAVHLNKSYDIATKAKMIFANRREYMLMSFSHHYTHGHFMDRKGGTRTSSLWSDGHLVDGYSDSDSSEFRLDDGDRGICPPDSGPRELFLG